MDKMTVTTREMQLIDKKAIEEFGIPSIVLMENAGKVVYEEALKMLNSFSDPERKRVLCICGKGNNGGDGFVAARYLVNAGVDVSIYLLCEESRLKKDPLVNFNILRRMGIAISCLRSDIHDLSGSDLIIDAIFGTGFKGRPDKLAANIIERINESKIPVLSVDVPSGLDASTGVSQGPCVKATQTVSFGLPKAGFYIAKGSKFAGKVIIKNIGFPAILLKTK